MIKNIAVIGLLLAVQGTGAWAAPLPSRETTASVEHNHNAPAYWDLKRERIYPPLSDQSLASGLGKKDRHKADAASHARITTDQGNIRKPTPNKSGAFDTVALAFNQVPMRKEWQRVRAAIEANAGMDCETADRCKPLPAAFVKPYRSNGQNDLFETLSAVNTQVNSSIRYQADSQTYGTLDYWASPDEILNARAGDCEDYVILKMALLRKLGVPTEDLSVVVLKDLKRDLYHAVLTVQTGKGIFVLDNAQPKVLRDDRLKHYLPLYSFSGEKSFIHGLRKEDTRFASAQPAIGATIVPGEGPAATKVE